MKFNMRFFVKRVEMEGFWRGSAIFRMISLRVYLRNQ